MRGFKQFCKSLSSVQLVQGLISCGFDLDLQQVTDSKEAVSWSLDMYQSLKELGDDLAEDFSIQTTLIHPSEVQVTPSEALLNVPIGCLRRHFAILKHINDLFFEDVLHKLDPRLGYHHKLSSTHLMRTLTPVLFQDQKMRYMKELMDKSAIYQAGHIAPEISLDPVAIIDSTTDTWFHQTMEQFRQFSSEMLLVPVPRGADPHYPLRVSLQGEEVQGNSGSFRQLLATLCDEIQDKSSKVPLLVPYLGPGSFQGSFFLRPGPYTILELEHFRFFGQILGLAARSGIPLALNIMPTFWKSLLFQDFDASDLKAFDPFTFSYLGRIKECNDKDAFESLLAELKFPTFTLASLSGTETELTMNGVTKELTFDNRTEYVQCVEQFRLKEFQCQEALDEIRIGLGTMIPIDFPLQFFTVSEIETFFTGKTSVIRVDLLKKNTKYLGGITEKDEIVQFFWSVLKSLSSKQLLKFLKFAANQERFQPGTTGEDLPLPFPMKLAPADR